MYWLLSLFLKNNGCKNLWVGLDIYICIFTVCVSLVVTVEHESRCWNSFLLIFEFFVIETSRTYELTAVKYFCVHYKNRRKHNQQVIQIAIFRNKFNLRHIKLNVYIWKTHFTFYKQYLFGLLFSTNAKKTQIQTKLH